MLALMAALVVWFALNRRDLGAASLLERLDELEEGVAMLLKSLLDRLGSLEELVPHVNLTHNANPLQPIFEALANRFSERMNPIVDKPPARGDDGQFAQTVIDDGATKE